jgi:hypothetical protein
MLVVFFTMVMLVMELSKLWEERAAIPEWRELVHTKEGIAGVKPTPNENAVAKSPTLGANAGDREALVDRGKQVGIAAIEAVITVIELTLIHCGCSRLR